MLSLQGDDSPHAVEEMFLLGTQFWNLCADAQDHGRLMAWSSEKHGQYPGALSRCAFGIGVALLTAPRQRSVKICDAHPVGRCFLGIDSINQCPDLGSAFQRQEDMPHCGVQ